MTSAKFHPLCKKNVHLDVYVVKYKTILPRSVTPINICLYIHNNFFCVIRKKKRLTFPDAIKKLEENFKYEDNQYSDTILKQVEEYKLPICKDKKSMYAVFAFDLENCNVNNQLYCESYSANVYHLNRLYSKNYNKSINQTF